MQQRQLAGPSSSAPWAGLSGSSSPTSLPSPTTIRRRDDRRPPLPFHLHPHPPYLWRRNSNSSSSSSSSSSDDATSGTRRDGDGGGGGSTATREPARSAAAGTSASAVMSELSTLATTAAAAATTAPAAAEAVAEAAAALRALAESGLPDAHLRAERYLVKLEQRDPRGRIREGSSPASAAPTATTAQLYECVIRAWANADREDPALAVTRAERWLNRLMDPHSALSSSGGAAAVNPSEWLGCFNAFLDLCSKGRGLKKNHRGQAKDLVWRHALQAEQILDWMIDHSSGGTNGSFAGALAASSSSSSPAPDIHSFNYVIRAWTRCRNRPDVADRALEALKKLELYHERVDANVRPNTRSYAMVMDAVAIKAKLKVRQIRNRPDSHDDPSRNGMDEIRLLNEMITYLEREHEHEQDDDDDLVSSSWNDAAATAASPTHCLATHRHILNALISAWSNLSLIHPNAPARAEDIVHQMTSRRDAWEAGNWDSGEAGEGGGAPAVTDSPVLPDATTFLLVMRSWAHSGDPARGDRVQHWLERQWLEHELDGLRESVRPTVASYNMVRFRRRRAFVDLAKPELCVFWGRAVDMSTAQLLINLRCHLRCSGDQVMRVWADLGEPGKAEAALMELQSRSNAHMTEQDAAASSSASLVPNSESYALVIRGWLAAAERGDKVALAQAVRWLDAVRDREDRDSGQGSSVLTQVDMYGGILSAARSCASRHPDVLEVAVSTFEKLRRSHHPADCLHYSRLLQAGLAALGGRPGKDSRARLAEFAARIFRDCCEDGLMSKPFVLALATGPPASSTSGHQRFTDGEYRRLVEDLLLPFHDASNDDDGDASDDDLVPFPASWTRNVRQVGILSTRHDLEKALFVVRQQHGHDLE
jgi:hypothetical protein